MNRARVEAAVRLALALALALITETVLPAHAEDDGLEIDLKLFGAQDLPPNPGRCHFALWQANRDPATDAYSYLFFLPFSENGEPLAARMKVGDEFIDLYEIAQSREKGPEKMVGGLPRHHVYRSDSPRYRVLIELLQAGGSGSMVEIDEADIYVVRSKKFPFLAGARGEYGCPANGPASAQADKTEQSRSAETVGWSGPVGIRFGPAHLLESVDEIPVPLRRAMFKYAFQECDLGTPNAWSGARYVVNKTYLLWEVPCFPGAYQGSRAFALTENPPGDWAKVLMLPNPPVRQGEENYGAVNAQVFNESGLITATEFGRKLGDCGVYQVFRLAAGPGRELELELLEYREKIDCNGLATVPEIWPLVFQSY